MENFINNLKSGLDKGAHIAGIVAPIAAVIVVASWFKSK